MQYLWMYWLTWMQEEEEEEDKEMLYQEVEEKGGECIYP